MLAVGGLRACRLVGSCQTTGSDQPQQRIGLSMSTASCRPSHTLGTLLVDSLSQGSSSVKLLERVNVSHSLCDVPHTSASRLSQVFFLRKRSFSIAAGHSIAE